MAQRLTISIENAVAAFVTYALSLMAAFSWNNAVQDYIEHSKWKKWVYAIGMTVLALIVLSLIMHYHEDETGARANTAPPQTTNRR